MNKNRNWQLKQVQVEITLKSEENKQDIKSTEGIFAKHMGNKEIKMKRNVKKKLKGNIQTMKQNIHIWFSVMWKDKIFWWKYLYT